MERQKGRDLERNGKSEQSSASLSICDQVINE